MNRNISYATANPDQMFERRVIGVNGTWPQVFLSSFSTRRKRAADLSRSLPSPSLFALASLLAPPYPLLFLPPPFLLLMHSIQSYRGILHPSSLTRTQTLSPSLVPVRFGSLSRPSLLVLIRRIAQQKSPPPVEVTRGDTLRIHAYNGLGDGESLAFRVRRGGVGKRRRREVRRGR